MNHTSPSDPHVMSFLAVRRAIGLVGLALPVVLYAYARVFGGGMQPSISEFYHTPMGDVLVGCLVAIGVFLIAYKGYPKAPDERLSDQWVSTLAGIGAIGVALFPATPPGFDGCPPEGYPPAGIPIQGITQHWCTFEAIHFSSAALLFICLAIFCFFLFPQGDKDAHGRIDWSTGKNRTYLVCGIAIIASIGFLLIYFLFTNWREPLEAYNYIFWWETVGVIAFAISWLVKGKMLQGVSNMLR